jgi:hypothetical protein
MMRPTMTGIAWLTLCLVGATPVIGGEPPAQNQQEAPGPRPSGTAEIGSVPASSVGDVGQRQTREKAMPNVAPTGRLTNRIQNRVQSRIRNRIDRNYDPQANATSPFAVAETRARTPR